MIIENRGGRTYRFDENAPIYKSAVTRIYYAIDETFNRDVCLKIITYDKKELRQILKNEVIALAKAGDRTNNVPMLIDFWEDEGNSTFYLVMQKIIGDSLRKKMATAKRREFASWMISLCDTVDKVHRAHIYHKDIKPENIIIGSNGDVYLIDFNISIEHANLVSGTEVYRAPEMHISGVSIARSHSDIFAFGVMMYEFFAGVQPIEGREYALSRFSLSRSKWTSFKTPKEICPQMPLKLSEIIEKCMKLSPSERYQTAQELKRDLISVIGEISKWKTQI